MILGKYWTNNKNISGITVTKSRFLTYQKIKYLRSFIDSADMRISVISDKTFRREIWNSLKLTALKTCPKFEVSDNILLNDL